MILKKIKEFRKIYKLGERYLNDSFHIEGKNALSEEIKKKPLRFEIINFLLASFRNRSTKYLEIGVRDPNDNYNKVISDFKYSLDSGIEFKSNPVDFKMNSDEFFDHIENGKILNRDIKFDVIFIDGLHLANQVEKDIKNSLKFLNDDGFIVLHDCNPPTEFNTIESHGYKLSPALGYWNGTTWKAFFKYSQKEEVHTCCIDTDWGIGIISKKMSFGNTKIVDNPFFEYKVLDKNRKDSLNLISYQEFKDIFKTLS